MTSKFNTLRANLPAERENKMKTAKEIFIEVWKEWFGDEDNDQLNIALKHDYIFESMERYKQVSVEPEVSGQNGVSQNFTCKCGKQSGWVTENVKTKPCPECGREYIGKYNQDKLCIEAICIFPGE